jgi:hypothetical protein
MRPPDRRKVTGTNALVKNPRSNSITAPSRSRLANCERRKLICQIARRPNSVSPTLI